MLAIERKNEILEILQKEQRVLVSELSKKYDVTDETIRRDLEKLESEGYVKKTYGGAVLIQNPTIDMPLRIREQTCREEKQIIAKLVYDLIEEGDRVMLDASSTSLMIAKELKNKRNLTVITNGVEVLIELAGHTGIHVISMGGKLDDTSLSLVGHAAEKVLNMYHVDKAVISCKGLDIQYGLTDNYEPDAFLKDMMCSRANTSIIAVDSSKFNHASFIKVREMKKGDILVTDREPPEEWKRFLKEREVRVVIPAL